MLNTWTSSTNTIIICGSTCVDVNMAPKRFTHKAAEHWSTRIACSILSALNFDRGVVLSVYEPNRIRHGAVRCRVFVLWVTKPERAVVLAMFTSSIAEMEYIRSCGMDMATRMPQLVRRNKNNTRKATSFLSELKRCSN